jgi:putative FmdB family regulatory protein
MALPVYEYRCSGGHQYDLHEGFDAPTQQKCIECGKTARRQLSLPAVIFKGSGFYSTDNRSGNRRNGGSLSDSEKTDTSSTKSDDHGHSHGDGGHSHGSSEPKVEASAS